MLQTMNDDEVDLSPVRRRFAPKWTPSIDCGRGWHTIIAELDAKLIEVMPDIRYLQIKEKFGGLRVYVTKDRPEVDALILEAEREAAETCEKCGAPGKLMVRNTKPGRGCGTGPSGLDAARQRGQGIDCGASITTPTQL